MTVASVSSAVLNSFVWIRSEHFYYSKRLGYRLVTVKAVHPQRGTLRVLLGTHIHIPQSPVSLSIKDDGEGRRSFGPRAWRDRYGRGNERPSEIFYRERLITLLSQHVLQQENEHNRDKPDSGVVLAIGKIAIQRK